MLDVRPILYVTPLAEQTIGPITPAIIVANLGDEDALITGLFRIYRESLGTMIYSSQISPTATFKGTSTTLPAETEFNPGSPADDDYFILCEITATSKSTGASITKTLPQFFFDIKTAPMGTPPATHHTTHENGGMDPIEVEDLGTDETNETHFLGNDGAGNLVFKLPAGLQATFSEATNPTPTPNADNYNQYCLTALAEAAAFAPPSGTPVDGQKLIIRITDDVTPRAITWDPIYANRGATLPTTTTSGKTTYVGLIYNAAQTTWDCVAATTEA